MVHNIYSLPDLIDLALRVPEVGAVNFNILHTILQSIVKELKLTDVRPSFHTENPFLTKVALTKARLKETERKKIPSKEHVPERSQITEVGHHLIAQTTEDDTGNAKDEKKFVSLPSKKSSEEIFVEEKAHTTPKSKDSAVQTTDIEKDDIEVIPTAAKEVSELRDACTETDKMKPVDLTAYTPEKSEITIEKKLDDSIPHTVKPEDLIADSSEKSEIPTEKKLDDSISHTLKTTTDVEMPQQSVRKDMPRKPGRGKHAAEDLWNYASLSTRVEAAEEGLNRLGDILDVIVAKMKKADKRRAEGGPSSAELEAFDERLLELEEAFAQFAADHKLLMDMNERLSALLKEFEAIKALAALLQQMQIDISKKADKEETWAALALKGDLELVNSKVDQLEFETAIEELGEAIGLLGLKFTRKNDEWEERASEIWKAIDSKMTFDVFEAARIKIESRLTALMYGLRKLKKVVEDLLYPEASGVTRCILCRRPACIYGLECMECTGIGDSPKRPLSARNSEDDEDPQKLRKTLQDAIAKRQKLEVPPYCEDRDTIITIPYRSASYRNSIGDEELTDTVQMKLKPVASDRGSASSKQGSQIPKLPNIDGSSSKKSNKNMPVTKHKAKSELFFTKKMIAKMERKSSPKDQKYGFTAVLEAKPSKKVTFKTSSKSSATSVDLTPDPAKTMDDFAPARLMPDTLRRDILLSPSSSKDEKPSVTLSPLHFDT